MILSSFMPLWAEGNLGAASENGSLRGTATYRERMALPPDAVFEATLEDVSNADAPAEVIGRARIEHPGNPPIHFEIEFDSSRIAAGHRYVIRARIVVDARLLFATDQPYPVFKAGESKEIALLLRRESGPAANSASTKTSAGESAMQLENTEWKLMFLGNTPIRAASEKQQPFFVLNSDSRRVSGFGGCNRVTGGYQVNGDHISFTQMASTMMACLEGMETERAFLDALRDVRRWKLSGHELELLDADGHLLARLQARTGT